MNRNSSKAAALFGAIALSLLGGVASAQTQYPITPPADPPVSATPIVLNPATPVAPKVEAATVVASTSAPTTTAAPVVAAPVVAAPVVAAPAAAPQVLGETVTRTPAFTGTNAARPLTAAGLIFVASGAVLLVATRRRRTTTSK